MSRASRLVVPSVLGLLAPAVGGAQSAHPAGHADSAHAAMQARGRQAMGVDQYTSSHVFDDLPDGGRVVLVRDAKDTAGTRVIRAHLRDVATAFAGGDFRTPAMVHAQHVPGTATLAARRGAVRYAVHDLPGGGELRITTSDADALHAVHEFLAFQRRDHRAPGGAHDASMHAAHMKNGTHAAHHAP